MRKNLLVLLGRNTDTIVGYGHEGTLVVFPDLHLNKSAFGSITNGVADEIVEDALEVLDINTHVDRLLGRREFEGCDYDSSRHPA